MHIPTMPYIGSYPQRSEVRLRRPNVAKHINVILKRWKNLYPRRLFQIFFFFFFFFFFDLGLTALSRIFHLYRADRSSKVGENRSTRRKTTWPSVSRTWLSHICPELGSNHSGEKPNGFFRKQTKVPTRILQWNSILGAYILQVHLKVRWCFVSTYAFIGTITLEYYWVFLRVVRASRFNNFDNDSC